MRLLFYDQIFHQITKLAFDKQVREKQKGTNKENSLKRRLHLTSQEKLAMKAHRSNFLFAISRPYKYNINSLDYKSAS